MPAADLMRGVVLTTDGPRVQSRPVPCPGPTELLVRVQAASLNRADLLMVGGNAHGAHGGAGSPLGLEWAGEVVRTGASVQAFRAGDLVMCSGIGGFADFAVCDWRRAFPVPSEAISMQAAACLPISLRTVQVGLVVAGGLRPGQHVCVLGASSAVGLMTLQAARALGAGRIVGTSTQAARRERLGTFGADVALDSSDAGWSAQVQQATGGHGVDLLVDFLAGPTINDSMRAVRVGGRIVNVGRMAGEQGAFDFDLHSLRRIDYVGTTFRTRTHDEVADIQRQVMHDLWPHLLSGRLGVPIDRRCGLEDIREAFDSMKRNEHFGKIVVIPGPV